MSRDNGIITSPVNIKSDIAYILGLNTGDVGTLCTTPLINKWAKYKPTKTADTAAFEPRGTIDDATRATAFWGLTIAVTFTTLANVVSGYATSYSYTPPLWYRVFDFIQCANGRPVTTNPKGYYHGAKSFVEDSSVETNSTNKEIYYTNYDEHGIDVEVDWHSVNNLEIGLNDLVNLGTKTLADLYFGVILYNSTKNVYRLICAVNAVGSASSSTLNIPYDVFTPVSQDLSDDHFAIYPVISEKNEGYTGSGAEQSGTLGFNVYSLPDITPFAFQVKNATSSYIFGDITNFSASLVGVNEDIVASLTIPYMMDLQVSGTKSIVVLVRIWAGNMTPETDTPLLSQTKTLVFTNSWLNYTDEFTLSHGPSSLIVRVSQNDYPSYYKQATCNVQSTINP